MTTPSVSDDPVAVLERAILDAEQRRVQQLAHIATLEGQNAPTAYAQRVLQEIETTLRRACEHYTFIHGLSDIEEP